MCGSRGRKRLPESPFRPERGPAFPYKARLQGEELARDTPVPATRPAEAGLAVRGAGPSEASERSNGGRPAVEKPARGGKDLGWLLGPQARGGVSLVLSLGGGRG